MRQQPLVSIIIPVYKVERFLSDCVESVLAQSYPLLDIILIDDGSPDNCPALCDAYAKEDPRIRVIHQANGGLSRARNVGLAAAAGEYVYFLDSDDSLVPEAIETLVRTAEAANTDIVFFEALLVAEDGGAHTEQNAHRRKQRYDIPMRGKEMLCRLIENNEFMTPVQYLFFRREFLAGRQFVPDLLYEDVLFTFLAFLDADRVIGRNEPLYRYRIRSGSIMTGGATRKHFESLLTVYRSIEARYADADAPSREAIRSELATLQQAEVHLYYRLSRADRRACRNSHRAFLAAVAQSNCAKDDPTRFAVSETRIRLTQAIHRILSADQRKKLRNLLRR